MSTVWLLWIVGVYETDLVGVFATEEGADAERKKRGLSAVDTVIDEHDVQAWVPTARAVK